jgi:AraC-like DNA-binding protein
MSEVAVRPTIRLLAYPYDRLDSVGPGRRGLKVAAREPGTAVVWSMGAAAGSPACDLLAHRPGGLPLIIILPPTPRLADNARLVNTIQQLRPQAILPHHLSPRAPELAHLLRRPPADLPAAVTDYLAWRGIAVDQTTIRMVRRIVELSTELRSVSALARGMYMSRRALGRRFAALALPVPSHWLQMARLIRVAIRLQNTGESVFTVACGLGYPDGFSASNQMNRLFGIRPRQARERLGWEWVLEAWLRREAENGALAPGVTDRLTRSSEGIPVEPSSMRVGPRALRRRQPVD